MGTKNNPGKYDCYASADPDEPMFVLLGRDPLAHVLVNLWATMREQGWTADEKTRDARECASAMYKWCMQIGRTPSDGFESLEECLSRAMSDVAGEMLRGDEAMGLSPKRVGEKETPE